MHEHIAASISRPRLYQQQRLPYAPDWSDVQRMLDIRDRAIPLLLAVYGRRSGEVAALRRYHRTRKYSSACRRLPTPEIIALAQRHNGSRGAAACLKSTAWISCGFQTMRRYQAHPRRCTRRAIRATNCFRGEFFRGTTCRVGAIVCACFKKPNTYCNSRARPPPFPSSQTNSKLRSIFSSTLKVCFPCREVRRASMSG